jgi:hypothetical protein
MQLVIETATCSTFAVAREPGKPHHFATVPMVRQALSTPAEAAQSDTDNVMGEQRTVVRSAVVRMVARYVALRQRGRIRSAAGQIAIDESRTGRLRITDADLDGLTDVQTLDLIALASLRRAIYAAPEKRTDVRYASGNLMRSVAPLRVIAQIVRSRPARHSASSPEDSELNLWLTTVASKLHHIPRENALAILEAETRRFRLVEIRNELQAARSAVQRFRSGGKNAKNLRRLADERVAEIRSREAFESDRLTRLVRTRLYKDGLELLWRVCTETPEIEAYCFGEE